jgi:hypothetical protein
MIREPKNVDFYTSGRVPSEEEFAQISEWIKQDKQKRTGKLRANQKGSMAPVGLSSAKIEKATRIMTLVREKQRDEERAK